MSLTIWKFPLALERAQDIEMPAGAEILSIGNQRETICLWARVETEKTNKETRRFVIVGTGHGAPDAVGSKLIGVVMMQGGDLIFHVFEID